MVIEFIRNAGHRQNLQSRVKKTLVSTTIAATLALGAWGLSNAPTVAGGETRTISLYHMHTGENLTITYKKDGRYIPSAMKQINYLLRDWRKQQTITIDPRTIDLVWELHEDLGSHAPIHIVCGYRSPSTNAFLRRIGRKVAKESQHMVGHAIDFYFPDVPTVKIRNSALAHQMGGVGFYRSAGGPTGFLHVDSGHVRHWGPFISQYQMASIMRDGRKTMGRYVRNSGEGSQEIKDNAGGSGSGGGLFALIGNMIKKKPTAQPEIVVAEAAPKARPVDAAYAGLQDDLADLSADAAIAPVKKPTPVAGSKLLPDQQASMGDLALDAAIPPPKPKLAPVVQAADNGADEPQVKQGYPVPKPRLKPVEIMLMAAANMKPDSNLIRISAASAPPPDQSGRVASPLGTSALSTLMETASLEPDPTIKTQVPNKKGKGNFAAELRSGTSDDAPIIKPLIASAGGNDINWWPQISLNADAAIRRDGAPSIIGSDEDTSLPKQATLASLSDDAWTSQQPADGKGDLLVVNREGKGSLEMSSLKTNVKLQKVGQLQTD